MRGLDRAGIRQRPSAFQYAPSWAHENGPCKAANANYTRCRGRPGGSPFGDSRLGPERQHLGAILGDRDCVLGIGAEASVVGDDCPSVLEDVNLGVACIYHRLDGEHIARLDQIPRPGPAVVGDLGRLVHIPSDSVADILTHHRVPLGLDVRLYRMPDVTDVMAWLRCGDAVVERGARHIDEPAHPICRLTARHRQAAVGPPPVENEAAVQRDEVAVAQDTFARDSVHHLVVDGHTQRVRKVVIADEAGDASVVTDERVRFTVEIERGDPRANRGRDVRQARAEDAPRRPHLLDLIGPFEAKALDALSHHFAGTTVPDAAIATVMRLVMFSISPTPSTSTMRVPIPR